MVGVRIMSNVKVKFDCIDCSWKYRGDMQHAYVVMKHKDKHEEEFYLMEDLYG